MKEYFDTQIKPINDELGRLLNMKKIKVEGDSTAQTIAVILTYTSHSGNRVTRKAGTKNFYEALGLKI